PHEPRERDAAPPGQEGGELHATAPAAGLPKRPAGRKSRMAIRSPKLTSSFIEGERNTAPIASATETRMPPANAPGRLPMPPMMAMLNKVTEKPSPLVGWKGRMGETRAPAAPTQAAPTPKADA